MISLRKTITVAVFELFFAAAVALAGDVRIATLNCYLLFSPAVEHQGNVAKESPLSPTQYQEKIANLLSLVKGAEFIALQETGGRTEIEDLSKAAGYQWAFEKGKDTYTGEEVGAIYTLPGWHVVVNGRIGDLDKAVSKHLLVTATKDKKTVRFLVVHLIRPIGQNAAKHDKQLAAIGQWAAKVQAEEPTSSVVVLGDTNDTKELKGTSIFGIGIEAGEQLGFSATHLDGKSYDRLILVGPGTWQNATVIRPPYGKRPNDLIKRVWTDHFALEATLHE